MLKAHQTNIINSSWVHFVSLDWGGVTGARYVLYFAILVKLGSLWLRTIDVFLRLRWTQKHMSHKHMIWTLTASPVAGDSKEVCLDFLLFLFELIPTTLLILTSTAWGQRSRWWGEWSCPSVERPFNRRADEFVRHLIKRTAADFLWKTMTVVLNVFIHLPQI